MTGSSIGGGSQPNTHYGTNGNDVLSTGSHSGILYGYDGNDTLTGGSGNDTIYSGNGNSLINGGSGNDYIVQNGNNPGASVGGATSHDTISGGAGNDTIIAGYGHSLLVGGSGNDYIYAGGGANTLEGGSGNDTLVAGGGPDVLSGGSGDNVFKFESIYDSYAHGKQTTDSHGAVLMPFQDIITDFHHGDIIDTTGTGILNFGQLTITHTTMDNVGAVTLVNQGTTGDHFSLVLEGTRGLTAADFIFAPPAPVIHYIYGDNNGDSLSGTSGQDYIVGGNGNDTIHGNSGDDTIQGGLGNNSILGGDGNDLIYGYAPSVGGGSFHNTLSGGQGNDTLIAAAGGDSMQGNSGNDLLIAGPGVDTMSGGTGNNTFQFNAVNDSYVNITPASIGHPQTTTDLRDIITDFQHGTDKIDITGTGITSLAQLSVTHSTLSGFGNVTIISQIEAPDTSYFSVILVGTTTMHATDFIFA